MVKIIVVGIVMAIIIYCTGMAGMGFISEITERNQAIENVWENIKR